NDVTVACRANWNPPQEMPDSHGCVHAWPCDIQEVIPFFSLLSLSLSLYLSLSLTFSIFVDLVHLGCAWRSDSPKHVWTAAVSVQATGEKRHRDRQRKRKRKRPT